MVQITLLWYINNILKSHEEWRNLQKIYPVAQILLDTFISKLEKKLNLSAPNAGEQIRKDNYH